MCLRGSKNTLFSTSFGEARCALIGQLSGALWLAKYLKHVNCYAPHRIVMPCDDTKTIKPIKNKAFVASSGHIITDYNDSYGLFTRHICDRRNDKQQALLYTAQNSRLNRR